MKLLLDEHLSPHVARRLREAGHDVVAVAEREDQRGQPDQLTWQAALEEGRALVTGDLADFLALAAAGGDDGLLVLVARARFPRSLAGIGGMVAALDALLVASVAPAGPIHWLQAAAEP